MNMKYLFTFIALNALFGSSLSLSLNNKVKQNTRCDLFTYTIQPGDSLYAIAVRYRDTINCIQSRNKIQNENLIFGGQQIQVCRLQYENCKMIFNGMVRNCKWVNAK